MAGAECRGAMAWREAHTPVDTGPGKLPFTELAAASAVIRVERSGNVSVNDGPWLVGVAKLGEDAGAIFDQHRRVDWRFRFDAEHWARQAEAVFFGHDYQVTVVPPGEGDHWAVTASLTAIVNLPYVVNMNAMMDTFASDQHGLFDGWAPRSSRRSPPTHPVGDGLPSGTRGL